MFIYWHLDLNKSGWVCEGINVVAGWDQCGGIKNTRERVHSCNVCDKAFKYLRTPKQHIICQHSGHVFVCKGCGKKFKTKNSFKGQKKPFGFKPHHIKRFCNFSIWGKGGGEEKDGSVQLQEEADILYQLQWK